MNSLTIKQIKSVSIQPVYDIEVPGNHNFILKNGIIAHNCAHSTSYGAVAYNGAWLKHHYPLYFWKGALATKMSDHDALREYIKECSDMILPVDILKSHPVNWMIEGDKLRAPLAVIKGCGDKGSIFINKFINTPIEDLLSLKTLGEEAEKEEKGVDLETKLEEL